VAGPSGLGAMSQGRDGLPGERSCSGTGRAEITGSREVAIRKRQFFDRALGPRRWSRSQAKAIRGNSRCPPGGPTCAQALALGGAGGRSGRTAKWNWAGQSRWIFKTSYFESSQSCRERAACFSILTIRLVPISSSRCELGIMIDMSPLAMTSCFDPG
jgi:hypothetical protein